MDEHDQVIQDFSTDSFHAGLYGRSTSGSWEFSGLLGFMSGKTSAVRNNPSFGSYTGGEARSELDQTGVHTGVQARRRSYLASGATFSTVFGLNYARIRQDGATETGGGDFNYSVDKADADALVASVGVDYSQTYNTRNGVLKPILFARYEFDILANKNSEHEITVTSPIFGSFTQVGQNRGPHGLVLGLGAGYDISEEVRFSAGYGYSWRSNGEEHGLGANLRMKF